jgi:alpha-methylacyl-CoA racemase
VTHPLAGLTFVEFAGIGPAPLAAMILADLGATGVRIESPQPPMSLGDAQRDITRRGRTARVIDIRNPSGQQEVLDLLRSADLLIEGFRPGVLERRGLGPQVVAKVNPRLVFGRITGWGQDGPLAERAGHDLTYLAVAGVLAHVGRRNAPPTPPLNLVGDSGAGTMLLLVGVLAALWQAQRTGVGQVVDAAIVDGSATLMSLFHSLSQQSLWSDERGVNLLDSGAPFYDVYRAADDRYLAVACLEPKFFAIFAERCGLDERWVEQQYDVRQWEVLRAEVAAVLATRTMWEWDEIFAGTDACVAPVLTMAEAAEHPHMRARGTFLTDADGFRVPAPAPRFRTP